MRTETNFKQKQDADQEFEIIREGKVILKSEEEKGIVKDEVEK